MKTLHTILVIPPSLSSMENNRADEIRDEIKRVTDFTSSYWYPAYEEAEKNKENTPTAPAIIWNIIKTKSDYVNALRTQLHELSEPHDCTLGCRYYQSGHSISAGGYCNMGCC